MPPTIANASGRVRRGAMNPAGAPRTGSAGIAAGSASFATRTAGSSRYPRVATVAM
jgi:hypothetical protein